MRKKKVFNFIVYLHIINRYNSFKCFNQITLFGCLKRETSFVVLILFVHFVCVQFRDINKMTIPIVGRIRLLIWRKSDSPNGRDIKELFNVTH